MAANIDIEDKEKIGDTVFLTFRFTEETDGGPDVAIPQAGKKYRLLFGLAPLFQDQDADYSQDLDVADTPTAADGWITFRVEASVTRNFKPSGYNYEIKEITPSSPEDMVLTRIYGKIGFSA